MSHQMTRRAFAALTIGTVWPAAHAAGAPPAPSGKAILSVQGRIEANGGDAVTFDRAGLEALGTIAFDTASSWEPKSARYEGVPMARIMQTVGARGSIVTAVGLDDYKSDLPISDFEQFGVMLALKRDGNYMPVRDKGPLWILYPFDSRPELRSEQYYNRAVWHVVKLIVK